MTHAPQVEIPQVQCGAGIQPPASILARAQRLADVRRRLWGRVVVSITAAAPDRRSTRYRYSIANERGQLIGMGVLVDPRQ